MRGTTRDRLACGQTGATELNGVSPPDPWPSDWRVSLDAITALRPCWFWVHEIDFLCFISFNFLSFVSPMYTCVNWVVLDLVCVRKYIMQVRRYLGMSDVLGTVLGR